MNLTFEAKAHEYRLDGVKIPSVSEILKVTGRHGGYGFGPTSAQRGTAVHKWCEIYDRGNASERDFNLSWDNVDEELKPFVEAYIKFSEEWPGGDWWWIEERVWSSDYLYAGTLDRRSPDVLLDIKTGSVADWHGLQLTAYDMCFEKRHKLFNLYLRSDGRYRLKEAKARPKQFLGLIREYNHR